MVAWAARWPSLPGGSAAGWRLLVNVKPRCEQSREAAARQAFPGKPQLLLCVTQAQSLSSPPHSYTAS